MKKLLILFLLTIISCGKKEVVTPTALQELGFFDIVYETVATRTLGDTTWIAPIVGARDVKFLTTTVVGADDSLPSVLEGTFTYSVQGYARLTSQSTCSGGYSGTFTMTYADEGTTVGTNVSNAPNYDIMTPYNTTDSSTATTTTDVATINTFSFNLTIVNKSFTPANCMNPAPTNAVKVVRFTNGDLIEDDPSKNLQYYLRPKLRIAR